MSARRLAFGEGQGAGKGGGGVGPERGRVTETCIPDVRPMMHSPVNTLPSQLMPALTELCVPESHQNACSLICLNLLHTPSAIDACPPTPHPPHHHHTHQCLTAALG